MAHTRANGECAMTTDPKLDAAIALHRFGFGPAGDAIATIAGDPRGAMLADLERPGAGLVAASNLPDSAAAARAFNEYRAELAAKQKLAQRAKQTAEAAGRDIDDDDPAAAFAAQDKAAEQPAGENKENPQNQQNRPPNVGVQLVQNEAAVRVQAAVTAEIGFVERLVWFWSNHFCVSAGKSVSFAGPYEREAIRPHVLGGFVDLLIAVESHQAMLFYLDNAESFGPDSVAGINQGKGLNENLAREILELHTLGVHGGYSQADVTSFANVLTGWSLINTGLPKYGGEFLFFPRLHEPGEQTVLGKRYPDTGFDQGRAVLTDLARHPATARHVAEKLARHFVADRPPQPLVDKLEQTFKATDGDLKEVAKALIGAEESWTPARTKLKRPSEWHVGALRLADAHGVIARFMGGQALMGEPLWRPPGPNGYSDDEAAWIDGLSQRLDIANSFAGRIADRIDPLLLVDQAIGPLASAETRDTIARAESRSQALAMLLMAPEFLRR
jgi:uncharacterized protein (DUF1800 family)